MPTVIPLERETHRVTLATASAAFLAEHDLGIGSQRIYRSTLAAWQDGLGAQTLLAALDVVWTGQFQATRSLAETDRESMQALTREMADLFTRSMQQAEGLLGWVGEQRSQLEAAAASNLARSVGVSPRL